MNVVNETPFAYAPFMGKVIYPKDTLTFIVKGTFQLQPDAPAEILPDDEQPPPTGDQYYDDDPQTSCRYESDFVHFKPRADVCVVGHCHVPAGIAQPACSVSFRAGGISKSLMVFGKRQWKKTRIGTRSMTDPEPFSVMALRYENSFGGPDYSRNPVGKGILPKKGAREASNFDLPNIKVLEGERLKTMDAGAPAGFGPLGRTWTQRMALAGTYGKKWQDERWPWLPEDFDWGYFNAAPADQQVKGYLKGDESLYFENMHPEHSRFASSLPGLRVRCFLFEVKDDEQIFREIKTQLDTLWVDMDAMMLVLVWRGLATVASKTCDQVEDVFIVQESVKDAPHPVDYYHRLFRQRKTELAAATAPSQDAEPAEPAADPAADVHAPDQEKEDGFEAMMAAAMGQAHDALGKSGLDPKLVAALKSESDPERFLDQLVRGLDIPPGAVDQMRTHARKKQLEALDRHRPEVEKLFVKMGLDPSDLDRLDTLIDDMEPGQEPPAPDPEALAEAIRSGEGAGDQDMSGADFSGMSLEGADFKEAQLAGANFLHARLAGADFSQAGLDDAIFEGADLTGVNFTAADLNRTRFSAATLLRANLSDAVLTGANLVEADLSEAILCRAQLDTANLTHTRMTGADLARADLTNANLSRADLSETQLGAAILDGADLAMAKLCRARGPYASLVACNLAETDFTEAQFEDSNFSNCRCESAVFMSAALDRSTFSGAVGRQVNLRSASLTQVRAGEGVRMPGSIFRRATGNGANWTGADLQGSDFILAQMPGCDFSAADLTGCDCRTAELTRAVFDKACMKGAQFGRANLFQVRMEEADLTGVNFKGCNLYGSEFLNATIDDKTTFDDANLKGTKLAKLKP